MSGQGSASASAFASLAFWAAKDIMYRGIDCAILKRNLRNCVDYDVVLHDTCNNASYWCLPLQKKKLHSILYVFHAILPSYPQYIPLNPPFIWDFYWFGCQRDPKGIFNGKGEINGNGITNWMYPMGLPSISIDFPLYISGKTAILYYTERRLY